MNKGNLTIGVATMVSAITIALTIAGAYWSGQLGTQDTISQTKLELSAQIAAVAKDTALNTYKTESFDKRMDRFENKLDTLLERNGVNPQAIRPPISITLATSSLIQ